MKIELKRDDPSLKDVVVEMKPGDYCNQAQYTSPVKISALDLVEFYEAWFNVATRVKYFASLKRNAENLLKELEELATYYDDDAIDYQGD